MEDFHTVSERVVSVMMKINSRYNIKIVRLCPNLQPSDEEIVSMKMFL